jgi:molybdopterin molybdotransferase
MTSTLLTVAQARERVLAAVDLLPAECVPVDDALGRVLARDLPAAGDVPPFTSAAMDGYAVRAGPPGRTLRVIGECRAGVPSELAVGAGEAIRTSTGAALPAGANAVIRQEQVETDGDRVTLRTGVAVADDVRHRGEDLAAGARVLARGTRLGPAELAAAVAAGARALACGRRPRVAILCTGTELRAPGEELGPGEIHNTNAATLRALATRCGAVANPAERLADDRTLLEYALSGAVERADVVVVSGGVSVGPHDHVKPVLDALAVRQSFWGVAIQPGKPVWFGTREGTLVYGLPGNPVAAFVAFTLFAAPALLALQGAAEDPARGEVAELARPVARNPARELAITVRLERAPDRTLAVPNGPQGSNLISSLLGADALALIPAGTDELATGSRVPLIMLPR